MVAAHSAIEAAPAKRSIQLHTDLQVKPGSESKLIDDFHNLFLPRIRKAPGFVDAKLVRFVKANVGSAPVRYNYRLIQIFESEELREKWLLMEEHKIAWHQAIESHVQTPFVAYLYEVAAESKPTR